MYMCLQGSVAGLSGRIALHISLDCPLVGNAQAAGDGRTLHAVCPHSLRPILQKVCYLFYHILNMLNIKCCVK